MQLDTETLCRYRLERAKEDLQAAKVNHDSGLFKASINRSYYAIFHGIRAVNILDGFDASKHSSVIAHFNQYFVHTGEFDRGLYKIIDGAYRIREKSDYSDFFTASREDSAVQLEHAETFVEKVEVYLRKKKIID
ncbi:MAG TPA: HEPN domain-containing protein [Candidatus Blautia ornithocaccae]|uniref:HEPN domain-containing protein n=1 Tax=Candidatus Blautia merdavium TaxID=2838494 RepID=A0A9D2PPB3_9FIRM|nr:HEPN domain-containing protein [Candidatus Blautia merdavium]HJD38009.1 HEPN domain-containing protein [Candidatus Blautia ornithocaccae]